jgi:hypothetical protein
VLAGRLATLYPTKDFWHSFLLKAKSNPGPNAAGNMKNPMAYLIGIRTPTILRVAQHLNQLSYRVPHDKYTQGVIDNA